ncbi:hypothetical protein [Klebsiella pneumoniae]|uniref:hypothetical protein n=1 Tax=Klebsiella pneumoniae TaxID=573 RepID=UPI003F936212
MTVRRWAEMQENRVLGSCIYRWNRLSFTWLHGYAASEIYLSRTGRLSGGLLPVY